MSMKKERTEAENYLYRRRMKAIKEMIDYRIRRNRKWQRVVRKQQKIKEHFCSKKVVTEQPGQNLNTNNNKYDDYDYDDDDEDDYDYGAELDEEFDKANQPHIAWDITEVVSPMETQGYDMKLEKLQRENSATKKFCQDCCSCLDRVYGSHKEIETHLFDCLSDTSVCAYASLCPCFAYGEINSVSKNTYAFTYTLLFNTWGCCCPWMLSIALCCCPITTGVGCPCIMMIKARKNMIKSFGADTWGDRSCCIVFCCWQCAITQMVREIRNRNDPNNCRWALRRPDGTMFIFHQQYAYEDEELKDILQFLTEKQYTEEEEKNKVQNTELVTERIYSGPHSDTSDDEDSATGSESESSDSEEYGYEQQYQNYNYSEETRV